MNRNDVCEKYRIPEKILNEYHAWGLCGASKDSAAAPQYSDADIDRLSMIMALHDIGLHENEVRRYMLLTLEGSKTGDERASMLETLRKRKLTEIHLRETQLERLDYLRREMENRL